MTKAIFKHFLIVLVMTLLLSSTISMVILSDVMLENTKDDMYYSLRLLSHQLDYDEDLSHQVNELNELTYRQDTRLTIINSQGEVLADSDLETIEDNHLYREEIQEALDSGIGDATRYSSTIQKNLLYLAYQDGDYIIRLSIPYSGIFDNMTFLFEPLMISGMMSLLVALVLSYRFTKSLSQPLVEISSEIEKIKDNEYLSFQDYKYQELNVIATKLKNQAQVIQKTMQTLHQEKIKINSILDQMNEGFILLDNQSDVIMCNKQAKVLYPHLDVYHSIYDYIFDYQICEALQQLGSQSRIVTIKKDEEVYDCHLSHVDYGVTLLFVNVTVSYKANQMRSEFFSNVSHELKTPMTAIKGYSELLQTGMIDHQSMKDKALSKIQKEVDQMSALINDILMISRLENRDIEVIKQPVDLDCIVDDVLESLSLEAKKKDLSIHRKNRHLTYMSNHQHMYHLMNNLISNAVKYNKDHGTIEIDIYQSEKDFVIEVSDTGRGISMLDQSRVFERFYRCDQGRDKETGGTGLGLAIVKHIVQYYQGSITLESQLDQGTTFKIVLPIE